MQEAKLRGGRIGAGLESRYKDEGLFLEDIVGRRSRPRTGCRLMDHLKIASVASSGGLRPLWQPAIRGGLLCWEAPTEGPGEEGKSVTEERSAAHDLQGRAWSSGSEEGNQIVQEIIGPRIMVQLRDRACQLVKRLNNSDVNKMGGKERIFEVLERSSWFGSWTGTALINSGRN